MTHRRRLLMELAVLTALAVSCRGGCGDKPEDGGDPTAEGQPRQEVPELSSLPEVTDYLQLVPDTAHVLAYTDDVAALRKSVDESPRLAAIRETDVWRDIMATDELSALKMVSRTVARLSDAPAGDVLVDEMFRGPGLVALLERDFPEVDFLIVKPLDTSQEVVAKAATWWLKAGEDPSVIHHTRGDVKMYTLPVAGKTIFSYVLKGALVLSDNYELAESSAKLVGAEPEGSIAAKKYLPSLGGHFSLVMDFESYGKSQAEPPLPLQGMRALGLTFDAKGEAIEVDLVAEEGVTLRPMPYVAHRYAPKDAVFHAAFTSSQPGAIVDTIFERASEGEVTKRVGVDLKKAFVPALDGEFFYTWHGVETKKRGYTFEHVVGFHLEDGQDVSATLEKIWSNVFAGPVKKREVGDAAVTCASARGGFCFGLHGGYLLIGPQDALDAALDAAAGKQPALGDRAPFRDAVGGEQKYAAALSLNLDTLAGESKTLLESIADPDYRKDSVLRSRDVKDTLGPFFDSLGALGGFGGHLGEVNGAKASGKLKPL